MPLTEARLQADYEVLALIDAQREEYGDENLGAAMERHIVSAWLNSIAFATEISK
jgi:hypothetical protein